MRTQLPLVELTAVPVKDGDLLARCVSGDRHAFGAIFDRYSRAVFAAAILIVRDRSDAEEVSSDTFLALWRKRESIHVLDGSILPWLITTARYEAQNRRRAQRPGVSFDDGIDAGGTLSVDSSVAEMELSRQLDDVVGRLTPADRQLVYLCLVDGISYDEAARRLGLTHATVRNRLHRARKQLRTDLERQDHDSND